MISPWEALASFLVILVIFLVVTIGMFWIPGLFLGCLFPDQLSEIVRRNVEDGALLGWWHVFIADFLGKDWGFQLNLSGRSYGACILGNAWDILLMTVGLLALFYSIMIPVFIVITLVQIAFDKRAR